jgi:hypothetical protein
MTAAAAQPVTLSVDRECWHQQDVDFRHDGFAQPRPGRFVDAKCSPLGRAGVLAPIQRRSAGHHGHQHPVGSSEVVQELPIKRFGGQRQVAGNSRRLLQERLEMSRIRPPSDQPLVSAAGTPGGQQ